MDNIDSLIYIHQAIVCKCTLQSNCAPPSFCTLVVAGAIASCVSGLSVVTSESSDAKRKKLFSLGQMASGHLPLIRTDKCKNSIMTVVKHFVLYTKANGV